MTLKDHLHRIWMMALMAYREARSEPDEGVIAVLYTVKERVHNEAKWEGSDYVGVITAKWQYSSITDPNDPQQATFPKEGDATFMRFLDLAEAVVMGTVANPAPGADSYYASFMDAKGLTPKWATGDKFIKQIGGHKFYRVL